MYTNQCSIIRLTGNFGLLSLVPDQDLSVVLTLLILHHDEKKNTSFVFSGCLYDSGYSSNYVKGGKIYANGKFYLTRIHIHMQRVLRNVYLSLYLLFITWSVSTNYSSFQAWNNIPTLQVSISSLSLLSNNTALINWPLSWDAYSRFPVQLCDILFSLLSHPTRLHIYSSPHGHQVLSDSNTAIILLCTVRCQ